MIQIMIIFIIICIILIAISIKMIKDTLSINKQINIIE